MVQAGDRLDLLAQARTGDATQFWHVADANTALDGRTLVETPGRHARRAEDLRWASTRFRIWFGDRAASRGRAGAHRGDRGDAGNGRVLGGAAAHGDVPRRAAAMAALARRRRDAVLARARRARHRQRPLRAAHRRPARRVDAALDSQPGRSTATMVVRDDSAFLEPRRGDRAAVRAPQRQRASPRSCSAASRRSATPASTAPQAHARDHDRAAAPCCSSCASWRAPTTATPTCCRATSPAPASAASCPTRRRHRSCRRCVLIGDDRNLAERHASPRTRMAPSARRRRLLRVDDQGIATFETSAEDLGLMRDLPAVPAGSDAAAPAASGRQHPRGSGSGGRGAGAAAPATSISLTGHVVPGCYAAVLTPYNKVRVDAGATPLQRRLPDHQGRAPHHAVAVLAADRGEERLGHRGLRRAGGRGAGRRPVAAVLGERGDLLMADLIEHTRRAAGRAGRSQLLRQVSRHRHRRRRSREPLPHPRHRAGGARRASLRLGACRRCRSPATATAWSCCRRSAPACGSSSRPAVSTTRSGRGAWWASGQRPDPQGPKRARHRLRERPPGDPRRRRRRSESRPRRRTARSS